MRIAIITLLIAAVMSNCIPSEQKNIPLPAPAKKSLSSLEETLNIRKSTRKYSKQSLRLSEISNLLWATYGKNKWGRKVSPSAGALYPLFIYLAVGRVENLDRGVYRYNPDKHGLTKISDRDTRQELSRAALSQDWIRNAAVVIVICARFNITTSKYGERGIRYVYMEVGGMSENIYLQASSLGLGTVAVGAFREQEVQNILKIKEEPLLLMPVGRPLHH